MRARAGGPGRLHQTVVSFARPLLRRALMVLRPPRVRMRLKKPCSLVRCRFLGWYVLFISFTPSIPAARLPFGAGRAYCSFMRAADSPPDPANS